MTNIMPHIIDFLKKEEKLKEQKKENRIYIDKYERILEPKPPKREEEIIIIEL